MAAKPRRHTSGLTAANCEDLMAELLAEVLFAFICFVRFGAVRFGAMRFGANFLRASCWLNRL